MARTKFRYQAPYATIYRVGKVIGGEQQCLYTSVQAAINAAIADGHTSNDNPAFIEIYSGTYTENLAFAPGVHLIGMGARLVDSPAANGVGADVTIVGNHTYANSNAATRTQNRVICRSLLLSVVNGITLTFSGTAAAEMLFDNCNIQKQTGGDATPAFQFTASNAQARVRFNDTFIFHETAGTTVMDLQRGSTEFRGKLAGVLSIGGVTLASAATLSNAASLSVANNGSFTSGPFTNVIVCTNNSNVVNGDRATFQNTLVGGVMFSCSANANIRMRQCGLFLQDTTSVLVKAVGAVVPVFTSVSNAFGGPLQSPFNNCDSAVFVQEYIGTNANRVTRSVYVGGGRGFSTIQAAINAAAAMNTAVGSGRTRVYIAPGFYVENLTLVDNVDLIADDQGASNNGFGIPVNISGHHTWTAGSANALVQITGIGFNTQVDQGVNPFFLFAAGAQTRPQLVFLECNIYYNFANARNLFTVTGTATSILSITRTSVSHGTNQIGQVVFDYSGASGVAEGHQLLVTGQLSGVEADCAFGANTGTFADTLMLKTGSLFSAFFKHLNLSGLGNRFFSIDHTNAVVELFGCDINSFNNAADAVFTKFNVSGTVSMNNCKLLQNGSLIAQDSGVQSNGDYTFASNPSPGVKATDDITIASNPTAGDTITINGTVVTFGGGAGEVPIGATPADTAQNLQTFLLANPVPNFTSLYVALSDTVTMQWTTYGTVGNGKSLTTSNGVAITFSSPTTTGGVNPDNLTINGQLVEFNVDVAIGATKEDTAQNLFNFINGSGLALIANNLYATYVAASAVVGIVARDTGTVGDAITLVSSAPAVVVPSGATLSGGVDGTGGLFQYGACSFTSTKRIQSSLTVVQNASTLLSV